MIGAVGSIKELSMRENEDDKGKKTMVFDKAVLFQLLRKVNWILSQDVIKSLLTNAEKITKMIKDPKTVAKRMKSISDFTGSMVAMVRSLSELGTFLKKGGTQGLEDLSSEWATIIDEKNHMSPSYFVEAFHEEVNSIKKNWKELDASLGKVEMKPLIRGMLGAKGDYTISIIPEKVELTVHLNVEMNAKQLATEIYKGNKDDTDGFFTVTPKVNKAALDGDGGG